MAYVFPCRSPSIPLENLGVSDAGAADGEGY